MDPLDKKNKSMSPTMAMAVMKHDNDDQSEEIGFIWKEVWNSSTSLDFIEVSKLSLD